MAASTQHYLLLDGAQIDDLLRRIYALEPEPEFHLLYQQTRYSELAEVGPVLIRTAPDSPLHAEFQLHWKTRAGIALDTAMPEASVVAHLRSLVHLRSDAEVVLLFRYYDPRILAAWLPDLDDAERARIMGPVAHIHLFSSGVESATTYRNPLPTDGQQYGKHPWLRLDSDQLVQLNSARQACLDQRLIEHLNRCFPACLANRNESERQHWLAACRKHAAEFGFSAANELARWVGFAALLGSDFPAAPEHDSYRALLTETRTSPAQRLENVMLEIQRQRLAHDKEDVA